MISKAQLEALPTTVGIYIFRNNEEIVYIGKSINIRERVKSHIERAEIDGKELAIIQNSNDIDFIVSQSEFQALILESKLIQEHRPKYNVIWRDDKSYLYIKIPIKDAFPRISLVRKENDGKSLYFGPFASTRNVRFLLRSIRSLVPFCTQKPSIKKPCFYSKIGLCNPCPAGNENNHEIQKQYRSQIKKVIAILNGKIDIFEKSLQKEITVLTKKQLYEDALVLRNKLFNLNDLIHLRSFERFEYSHHYDPETATEDLIALLNSGGIAVSELKRIECYDVSNLSQKEATASLVVATGGLIDKQEYRRFKLKSAGVSDFQMLKEALTRRFNNKWEFPSLIVVDGGAPQALIISRLLTQINIDIPLIGIAKHPDRLVLFHKGTTKTLRPLRNRPGFMLVQQLRDESHRFAKKYHLFLRNRRILV